MLILIEQTIFAMKIKIFLEIATCLTIELLLFNFYSCKENETLPCGCSGIDGKAIEETYGTVFMHEEKPYLITLESGYITSCDTTKFLISGQVFEKVVGKVKSTCTTIIDTAYAYHEHFDYKASYFEIYSFKELTSPLLYSPITWKQFTIEIIKSEDFGYPKGFGFKITNSNNGFNLVQPILPVAGFVPCKTEQDAVLVAFLYVSKMYLQSASLVSVYETELEFLGVYTP